MTLILEDASYDDNAKHHKYNTSVKGYDRKRRFRHDNSKWETDTSYLSRRFVAWDGEGITLPSGEHLYVMLANSEGGYVADPAGLSTDACFRFLRDEVARIGSGVIHIIYGGGYDANMWLGSFPRHRVFGIYTHDYYTVDSWRIQWRRGKSFYLRHNDDDNGFTIYDVMPFFQCPFIKACDDYLGDRFIERDLIVRNKALRSGFTLNDVPEVRRYNAAELQNLVALATELRIRLNAVGLRPRRWDGPGAIASALLTREGVKNGMAIVPPEVSDAARYAYAGGRFEVVRSGHVSNRPSYEYDINSAYPHALRRVPNLAAGYWEHVTNDLQAPNEPSEFALYHIRYCGSDSLATLPGPLFRRSHDGSISYPLYVDGWFWGPEAYAAQRYCERYADETTIEYLEVWRYHADDPTDKPFGFIEALYAKRRLLKEAGDGSHVGIKLGLNSLYGKLAQQVGWRGTVDDPTTPPFHQLEWAGYATATCRATVLLAGLPALDTVVAYETDALFTSQPLDRISCNGDLGGWEQTVFASLTYCQSGLYFGTLADGREVAKTRGVDLGSVERTDVLSAMRARASVDRCVSATLTRFVGVGLALQTSWAKWRRWLPTPKTLRVEPSTGKRWHDICSVCDGDGIAIEVWHYTYCPFMGHDKNYPFPIEWLPNQLPMPELEEKRHEYAEYDWEVNE